MPFYDYHFITHWKIKGPIAPRTGKAGCFSANSGERPSSPEPPSLDSDISAKCGDVTEEESIQIVYNILKDGPRYAQWWKPAYVRSDEVGPQKVTSLVRAKLPYTLTFTTELVRENFPHDFEIKATGELVGTGLWKFKQEGAETWVDFYWDVQATKPLVRWLSLFFKPIFKWNHDWVMRVGEKGLQKLLFSRNS